MVRHHLDISTAHMPGPDPDFGDGSALEAVEHEHGFVVFVQDEHPDEPAWIRPALALARVSRCTLINFDRDADVHPALPSFDW